MKEMVNAQLVSVLQKAIKEGLGLEIAKEEISLEHPSLEIHGDYTTSIALRLAKKIGISPKEIAIKLVESFNVNISQRSHENVYSSGLGGEIWEKVEIAGAGFINFFLKPEVLVGGMNLVLEQQENYGRGRLLVGRKIMVEYAHPNTHKEMHIGHLRTLVTGEALARLLEFCGAAVFRANYQGDIGPHVAKAIWGTGKILEEANQSWEGQAKLALGSKAHLLGQGYARGSQEYEANVKAKEEIDELNRKLYQNDPSVQSVYRLTRQWSLDYYDEFYKRFGTKFDKLYFESETAGPGKELVLKNIPNVFTESDGAIIFDGERYGLHKRVFITGDGHPTYEAKDIGLASKQYADFFFDECVHVVANEQSAYFQVVFKALGLVDSKFISREKHLPMGMVQLVGRKMSSRTGVVVTVDGLIADVKELLKSVLRDRDLPQRDYDEVLEAAAIGAVKYSVLKVDPTQNVSFDLERSVSLEGDSGPYLQYTYARAQSVLRKYHETKVVGGETKDEKKENQGLVNGLLSHPSLPLSGEELAVLRFLYRLPEVVELAARDYKPSLICSYLFELAKRFNGFYNNVPILEGIRNKELGIKDEESNTSNSKFIIHNSILFRLSLTAATAQVLQNGLGLLGIEAPERM